jgi:4-hydroxy-tetrahydrodipicolinate reductase
VVAAQPDCVLYMPLALDLDDVCALLEAGIDIVTTRGELHRPASMPEAQRERIEAACAAGGSSIHSTGSSPGFITEALPIVVASIQRRLDHLAIHEYADLSLRPSPDLLFGVMGFGRPPAEVPAARLEHGRRSFGPSLQLVAEELGLAHDDLTASGAVASAAHDVAIAAGTIAAGTVAAQQTRVALTRRGEPVLSFSATWYCSKDLDADWDLRDTGWRMQVDGDAPLDIDLRFPFPLEQMAEISPAYTANRAVNAVEVVRAAPPGIRTTVDLPQIVARDLRSR